MRIEPIDMEDTRVLLELLTLQLESYAVEARLVGIDEIPPLADTPDSLRKSGETFIGCFDETTGRLVGAAAYQVDADESYISRMMVHPSRFRCGIASRLLASIEASTPPELPLRVTTGSRNEPAMRLYEKHGFIADDEILLTRYLSVTMFIKHRSACPAPDEG
jgi:ribosomal protein S18 acetylase RimI-like enzyme